MLSFKILELFQRYGFGFFQYGLPRIDIGLLCPTLANLMGVIYPLIKSGVNYSRDTVLPLIQILVLSEFISQNSLYSNLLNLWDVNIIASLHRYKVYIHIIMLSVLSLRRV
jgi:hypothetical protein